MQSHENVCLLFIIQVKNNDRSDTRIDEPGTEG